MLGVGARLSHVAQLGACRVELGAAARDCPLQLRERLQRLVELGRSRVELSPRAAVGGGRRRRGGGAAAARDRGGGLFDGSAQLGLTLKHLGLWPSGQVRCRVNGQDEAFDAATLGLVRMPSEDRA